jgi:hypothetical protein
LPQIFTTFLTILTNEYNKIKIITLSISEFQNHFTTNYTDIVKNNWQGIQQVTGWRARREHRRAPAVGVEAGGLGGFGRGRMFRVAPLGSSEPPQRAPAHLPQRGESGERRSAAGLLAAPSCTSHRRESSLHARRQGGAPSRGKASQGCRLGTGTIGARASEERDPCRQSGSRGARAGKATGSEGAAHCKESRRPERSPEQRIMLGWGTGDDAGVGGWGRERQFGWATATGKGAGRVWWELGRRLRKKRKARIRWDPA